MNISTIDLNLLRVFHVLTEERSVTKTAERLGLSQPAVSNALKRLRSLLHDELFVRGQGGMVPTPKAERLIEPIGDALRSMETALLGGEQIDPTRIVEPILITCADEEIVLHGADILRSLDACGCPAPIQFLPLNTEYGAAQLWRNRLSLTVTTILFAPEGLKQRKVYDEHLVCLVRADHPAAKNWDLDAYLEAEHLLIAPLGGSPQGYLDDWLRSEGLSRRIRFVSHSFGAALNLVHETGLIATIPSRLAERSEDPRLVSLPLPVSAPPFSLHIFWSERYDNDPVNKWLRNRVYSAMSGVTQPLSAEVTGKV
ncbi:MAG: LysR family transcriptional regulator [Pseudomonadota bacterium]